MKRYLLEVKANQDERQVDLEEISRKKDWATQQISEALS